MRHTSRLVGALGAALMLPLLIGATDEPKTPLNARGVILQFNGKAVGGVEAITKNKEFRPVFEKELAKLAADVKGKPALKLTAWFTIINGCAVGWGTAPDATARELVARFRRLPYVKTVELDAVVGVPPR